MKIYLFILICILTVSQFVSGKAFFRHSFRHKWHKHLPYHFHEEDYEQCFLPGVCRKALPDQTETEACIKQRQVDVALARLFYKITEIGSPRATSFPIKEIPYLNQSIQDGGFYFSLDKFEGRYVSVLASLSRAYGQNIVQAIVNKFKDSNLDDPRTHIAIKAFAEGIIKSFKSPHVFTNPGLDPSFTDVINNGRYTSDETFVQLLLTRSCPFTIRRVTASDTIGYSYKKLEEKLNKNFNVFKALEPVIGEELAWTDIIEEGLLYVSHNDVMDGVRNQKDFYEGKTGNNTLNEATSPISLFVLKEGLLKVLAIQLDHTPDSNVVTPDPSSFKWTQAKASAISMHKQFCDAYMHGGHIHSIGALFCMVFRRHFSVQHPLYEVLKHHCEGTTPHFLLSFGEILAPGGFIERTHGVAHQGVEVLIRRAFEDRKFGQMDLPVMLKRLGFSYYHNNHIHYYPFRDDGKLIWKQLRTFLHNVVQKFYNCDEDVQKDTELQSFASEMTYGGVGNFTGFPSQIKSRMQLRKTLQSLIWYAVLHGVINYGIAPSFPLGAPIKLYTNEFKNNTVLNFGNLDNVAELVRIENLLGSLRINRIMDYYDSITDPRLKRIVYDSYKKFHGYVQKTLEKRNAERKSKNQLGLQLFEPKYLPNSIHI